MTTPVRWGDPAAIRASGQRAVVLLAAGLVVVLAIPIFLALDVLGTATDDGASGAVLVVLAVVVLGGIAAGVVGFRRGAELRATYWLEPAAGGLELWRGSQRAPVATIPWTQVAAARTTADGEAALWLQLRPRGAPAPGTPLSEVGRALPARHGASREWDVGIRLDPRSGDPAELERLIINRLTAPPPGSPAG